MITIGVWDQALHDRYRAAEGPLKRRLQGELMKQNEPLARTILAQLLGKSSGIGKGRKSAAANMGGRMDFERIEDDDAWQYALIGLAQAIEKFNPAKGKISFQIALWVRNYLQKYIIGSAGVSLDLARAPDKKAHLRPKVGLVGLPPEDEERTTAEERAFFGGTARYEDMLESEHVAKGDRLTESRVENWEDLLDAEDLADCPEFVAAAKRFQDTGEWPEELATLEAWRNRIQAPAVVVPVRKIISIPRTPEELFILDLCVVTKSGRGPRHVLGPMYEQWAAERGYRQPSRQSLYSHLRGKGFEDGSVRWGTYSTRAFCGVTTKSKDLVRAPMYEKPTVGVDKLYAKLVRLQVRETMKLSVA